jgi:hypothetical protein
MEEMTRYMMMSATNIILSPIITVAVAVPVIIYIVARWRSYRDHGAGDPQLGLKVAICLFKNVSFQLMLAGGFLFLYGTMTTMEGEAKSQIHRMGGGLFLPGLLIYVAHSVALLRTNWRVMPAVVRMFSGLNLIQTGIAGFAALVFACFLLFQKDVPSEASRVAWSMVLIYTTAWAVLGALFGREVIAGEVAPAIARETHVDDSRRSG